MKLAKLKQSGKTIKYVRREKRTMRISRPDKMSPGGYREVIEERDGVVSDDGCWFDLIDVELLTLSTSS
jgi:hypothetical protein